MDQLDARRARTETLLEKHGEMLDRLDRRMDQLDERQTKTEITLENTIVPALTRWPRDRKR